MCAGCCRLLNIHILFSLCVYMFVCMRVRERGVTEKSLSQCMTLSNRLGIKLMTRKTFSTPKPIYTTIQASLMSALKSTTNSPWRKSLAHRECSGCLSVGAYACARLGICKNLCTYVYIYSMCVLTI